MQLGPRAPGEAGSGKLATKTIALAAFLAAQTLPFAQPAAAADLNLAQEPRPGAFGGVRVRVPLDGHPRQRQVRAGLTIAPTLHSRSADGSVRMRIGEGLELGLRGREPVRLSIAGQDLRRLAAQQSGDEEDDDGGIPTGAWIAGGIVLVALAGAAWLAIELDNSSD
jgi:hypothetical protein